MLSISFFLALTFALSLLPWTWRLSVSVWASILQIYTFPVLGFYPSIAMIGHLSLSPSLLRLKYSLTQGPVILLLCLIGIQLLSLSWSADKALGLSRILYELPFILTLAIGFELAKTNQNKLYRVCTIYAGLTLIPILLLLVMRIHYNLDAEYLETQLASIFIDPNMLKAYPHTQNEIRPLASAISDYMHMPLHFGSWLDKPHSIFMDPDICASYFGTCGLLLWGMGHYWESRFLKIMGSLNWLATFLIFSRIASILGLSIPLILGLIRLFDEESNLRDFSIKKSLLILSGFMLLISLLAFIKYEQRLDNFLDAISAHWTAIHAALPLLRDDLFYGLGFGGWTNNFFQFHPLTIHPVIHAEHPPHNSLLQLLSESGVIALTLGIIFIGSLFYICYSTYQRLEIGREKLVCLCFAGAFAWVCIEGMSENSGLLGDIHVQPILALGLALLLAMKPKDYEKYHHE